MVCSVISVKYIGKSPFNTVTGMGIGADGGNNLPSSRGGIDRVRTKIVVSGLIRVVGKRLVGMSSGWTMSVELDDVIVVVARTL